MREAERREGGRRSGELFLSDGEAMGRGAAVDANGGAERRDTPQSNNEVKGRRQGTTLSMSVGDDWMEFLHRYHRAERQAAGQYGSISG